MVTINGFLSFRPKDVGCTVSGNWIIACSWWIFQFVLFSYWLLHNVSPCSLVQSKRGGSRRLVLENVDKIDDALVLYSIWWNWSIEPQIWARLYSTDWNNNQRQERERLMKEKDRVVQLTSFDVLNFPMVKWSNGCLFWTCLKIERNTNKKEITHIFITLIHCGILVNETMEQMQSTNIRFLGTDRIIKTDRRKDTNKSCGMKSVAVAL